MVEAVAHIDELVKDYLLFRGMTNTFKSFETDLKNDKEKGYRADKIVEQILFYIQSHDLVGLKTLWKHLDKRLFSHLEYTHSANVRKIEVSLLRLYVITAVQTSHPDKVTEFFEKMSPEFQNQTEWKEWYALPFMKSPEQNQAFETYFSKQWQDTLLFSLQNFLSIIFQGMPLPSLLSFDEEQEKMKSLEDHNNKLQDLLAVYEDNEPIGVVESSIALPLAVTEITDDFDNIAGGHKDFGHRTTGLKGGNKKSPLVNSKNTSNNFEKTGKNAANVQNLSKTVGSFTGKSGDKGPLGARALNVILRPRKGTDVTVVKSVESSSRKSDPSSTLYTSLSGVSQHNQPTLRPQVNFDQLRKELFQKSKETLSKVSSKGSSPKSVVESAHEMTETVPSLSTSSATHVTASQSISAIETEADNQVISPFIVLSSDEYVEHHSSITHCKFSPTATSVATMDIDGVVKIWSFSPIPTTVATIMYKAPLLSLEWVPKQPKMVLLGSSDGFLKLYDTDQKKAMTEIPVDPSCPKILSLACNPVGEIFASSQTSQSLESSGSNPTKGQSRLLIWDIKYMKPQREFLLGDGNTCVNSMAFNHNGNLMVTGASDGYLRLFDVQSCNCILQWKSHFGPVHAVNFSPDEISVFSMGADGKFAQWPLYNPEQRLELPIHEGATGPFVMSGYGGYKQQQSPRGKLFAFDSGGKYILTCAPYGGIIYELKANGHLEQMLTMLGHRTPVVSVDWSTSVNTGMCLTGSMDGKVQITTLLSQ